MVGVLPMLGVFPLPELPLLLEVFSDLALDLDLEFALAFLPAAAEDEEEVEDVELELELPPSDLEVEVELPELKAPILAPLKSTLLVLLIRVPRLAAIRLPLPRVFSSAADITVINTNLYLV